MTNRPTHILSLLFFLVVSLSLSIPTAHAFFRDKDYYTPISIDIEMEKKTFVIKEPVQGTITLENSYPRNLPAVFHVELYKDGEFIAERITSLKAVPAGRTRFSLKSFGVPHFNGSRHDRGRWTIRIFQQHDEENAKEVTVRIQSGIIPERKLRK